MTKKITGGSTYEDVTAIVDIPIYPIKIHGFNICDHVNTIAITNCGNDFGSSGNIKTFDVAMVRISVH
jgi:hypothetical protein